MGIHEAAVGSMRTAAIAITGSASGSHAERATAVLGVYCYRDEQRGGCNWSWSVATCGYQMVPGGGRYATSDFRPAAKPLSGRYLSLVEREDIALLLVQGHSLHEIGRRLGRSASTISREVRRNATTRSGALDYRATVAQWHAERSARRPKVTKLAGNVALPA